MQCYQCQNVFTNRESISCNKCNSKYHHKCVNGAKRNDLESGDRKYQWVCSSCQLALKKANTLHIQEAINSLTEKVELINKYQIPKLSNDLIQVRNTMDCLVKQNEDIIKRLEQLNLNAEPKNCFQKRNLKLSREKKNSKTDSGGSEKNRLRSRRKSRSLLKLLIRINKKLSRRRSSGARK
ncbi:uncharacterized protein LOC121739372 [Aricia agestis]|uniref:uncharacterized protein LOC121739372 n=1 Tax=Aricia agestis TaxID=91739 RepID=UPI001C2054A8|nr:uncharacterized protein LOC121739372 [Aricia agestis]